MVVTQSQILHHTLWSKALFAGGEVQGFSQGCFDSGLPCRRILSDINQWEFRWEVGMLLMDLALDFLQ